MPGKNITFTALVEAIRPRHYLHRSGLTRATALVYSPFFAGGQQADQP